MSVDSIRLLECIIYLYVFLRFSCIASCAVVVVKNNLHLRFLSIESRDVCVREDGCSHEEGKDKEENKPPEGTSSTAFGERDC